MIQRGLMLGLLNFSWREARIAPLVMHLWVFFLNGIDRAMRRDVILIWCYKLACICMVIRLRIMKGRSVNLRYLTCLPTMTFAIKLKWNLFDIIVIMRIRDHVHCVGKISNWVSNMALKFNRTDAWAIIQMSHIFFLSLVWKNYWLLLKFIFCSFVLSIRLVAWLE